MKWEEIILPAKREYKFVFLTRQLVPTNTYPLEVDIWLHPHQLRLYEESPPYVPSFCGRFSQRGQANSAMSSFFYGFPHLIFVGCQPTLPLISLVGFAWFSAVLNVALRKFVSHYGSSIGCSWHHEKIFTTSHTCVFEEISGTSHTLFQKHFSNQHSRTIFF